MTASQADESRKLLVLVGIIFGGIMGLCAVRLILLDPVEVVAWTIFWAALQNGNTMDIDVVLKSTTFLKCFGGLALGACGGGFVLSQLSPKRSSR